MTMLGFVSEFFIKDIPYGNVEITDFIVIFPKINIGIFAILSSLSLFSIFHFNNSLNKPEKEESEEYIKLLTSTTSEV